MNAGFTMRRGRQLQQLVGDSSETFDVVEPAQLLVERRKWDMSSFAGRLQHHAVREAKFGAAAKPSQGSVDDFGILQDEISMIEQHVNGGGELLVRELEDRVQYPDHFDQDEMGHPRALRNERLRSRSLARIVAREKANDDVGVNGAHDAWPRHGADRPSAR